MTDLERRLRNELRDEVDRVPSLIPDRAPGSVRRAVRLRQTATFASITVLVAALAALGLIARGIIDDPSSVRPAESPTAASESKTLITEGFYKGDQWQYFLVPWEDGDWCTRIELGPGNSGACGVSGQKGAMDHGTSTAEEAPAFVDGDISQEVTRVVVELADGSTVEAPIFSPPADLGVSFKLFIVAVDSTTDTLRGSVTAYDANGDVLEKERFSPTPTLPVDELPEVPDEATVLVRGQVRGGTWEVVAFRWDLVTSERHVGDWCLGERIHEGSGPGGFGCGFSVPLKHLRLRTSASSDFPTLVAGALPENIAKVRIELDSGEVIEPAIVQPPEGSDVPFNAFALFIDGVAPQGRVLALSQDGTILDSEHLPPPPDVSDLPHADQGWSSGTGP